ncbi:alkaline phosphatase family protein [Haloplanus aerogenes]|uniref:Uncharacterized protein n=1 Tax=Haloplanus aerogenes TaxID=660522 RepID=A0A3M0DS83_9EURY|nr:hypothetical protein [Haloplanus aerogenes]AZH26308.1 hypothetical protein DU502_13460 [Haloplanus aerogenes]RMB18233.1 hypothetical protein ATH50_1683 [Haloplanus aerogenes]
MGLADGLYRRIRSDGVVGGVKRAVVDGVNIYSGKAGRHINYGQRPLDEEWDILVLLDACRYDLFTEFAPTHAVQERFESVDSVYSCASTSKEWMRKVYEEAEAETLQDIHLVSANGWEPKEVDLSKFGAVTPVWEHTDFDIGTIRPQKVTDAAVHAGRSSDCERFIVHYMQPHAPFIHCAGKYDSVNDHPGQGRSQNVWEGLKEGKYDRTEVWNDYGTNLLSVLDHVETLAENMSGRMVVSADHGNALGEWGIYGHPGYVPLPALKRVPWATIDASDEHTYEPDDPLEPGLAESDVDEHLRALGYKM